KSSVSSTKKPYFMTLTMRPSKSSPRRDSMNLSFFHSMSSRSASSAARSAWEEESAMSCRVSRERISFSPRTDFSPRSHGDTEEGWAFDLSSEPGFLFDQGECSGVEKVKGKW